MNSKKALKTVLSITTVLVGLFTISSTGYASDARDYIKDHQRYVELVAKVGNKVDPKNTRKMVRLFQVMKEKHPEAAKRFLRGLRFEIREKAQRMGVRPSIKNRHFRKWVSKYMKEWAREADEHLYRVASYEISR